MLTDEDMLKELELVPIWAKQVSSLVSEVSTPSIDWESLKKTLFGSGDKKARWMFVGDFPNEVDLKAESPFAGEPGQLLDKMLAAIQLNRHQNVFLSYLSSKVEATDVSLTDFNHLLSLLKPKLIFVFGEVATQKLLGTDKPLDSLRGAILEYEGFPMVASYSPTDLLANPQYKSKAWADLCMARDYMLNP
jgi:uracil-DNA glycosylase